MSRLIVDLEVTELSGLAAEAGQSARMRRLESGKPVASVLDLPLGGNLCRCLIEDYPDGRREVLKVIKVLKSLDPAGDVVEALRSASPSGATVQNNRA
jgi:hypothetical protein